MNELVSRLSKRKRSVIASRIDTAEDLRNNINDGSVFLNFNGTKGGTELSVKLIKEKSSIDDADFEQAKGTVRLVGELNLNYHQVEVVADIQLETLKGKGKLIVIDDAAQRDG